MTIGLVYSRLGDIKEAGKYFNLSIEGMRKAGDIWSFPQILLARANFHRQQKNNNQAWKDLNEAMEIAERGSMWLWLMDGRLLETKLLLDRGDKKAAKELFLKTEKMIKKRKYGLKYPECKYLRKRLKLK